MLFWLQEAGNPIVNGRPGVLVSAKEGGSLLGYEDEDPQIRADYLEALAANGVTIDMPDELYRAAAG